MEASMIYQVIVGLVIVAFGIWEHFSKRKTERDYQDIRQMLDGAAAVLAEAPDTDEVEQVRNHITRISSALKSNGQPNVWVAAVNEANEALERYGLSGRGLSNGTVERAAIAIKQVQESKKKKTKKPISLLVLALLTVGCTRSPERLTTETYFPPPAAKSGTGWLAVEWPPEIMIEDLTTTTVRQRAITVAPYTETEKNE